MYIDLTQLNVSTAYKLLTSTIVPRPIAWVISQSQEGLLNAAPFSFFNAMSANPPTIALGIARRDSGAPKDTWRNINETKQFVVNLVTESMAEAMNVTATEFEAGVNELEKAKLATLASTLVAPPRIQGAPVSFECELFQTVPLSEISSVILGKVLALHIEDRFISNRERLHLDTPAMRLISRMHGAGWYARTTDLFKIDRIPVEKWVDSL